MESHTALSDKSFPSLMSYASTLRLRRRSECWRFAGLELGPEKGISTVPFIGVSTCGNVGYRPHLTLSLFQGCSTFPLSTLGTDTGKAVLLEDLIK